MQEFDVNKGFKIKFLNLASSRINFICCNKIISDAGVTYNVRSLFQKCCLRNVSINIRGSINDLSVGLFWESDPYCLLLCSLKRYTEQFIRSLQHLCVLVWLGLTISKYFQLMYFWKWLIFRSDPDALLIKNGIPSRFSHLGCVEKWDFLNWVLLIGV